MQRVDTHVDIYVNDHLGLAQGGAQHCSRVQRVLFESIDPVFRPLSPDDPTARQEPISVKKSLKGDGSWQTQNALLGWVVDSIRHAIELPCSKTCVATKRWHQMLGELHSMVLAMPGLRGSFSLLQEALGHDTRHRIRLTPHTHDFLDDLRWLARNLENRPTRLREIVETPVASISASDAAAAGMGCVIFANDQSAGKLNPLSWRVPGAISTRRTRRHC